MKISAAKTVLVAGMIASVLLLGACASFQHIRYETVPGSDGYARPTGLLATEWGQLPTYSHQPVELREFKDRFSRLPILLAGIDNTATVDLLVDRDGSVRDVAIIEGTGKPELDYTVKSKVAGVRITTKIAPQDPAPYVFRTKVVFQKQRLSSPDYSLYHAGPHYTGEAPTHANDWVWGNR